MPEEGPSVRGPNAVRHARSRAALLAAARTVFVRDGFARARTGDLVDATGLTRGALYYHFPDKVSLFDAVVEEVARELVTRIGEAADVAPDALSALRAGCVEWLDAMAEPDLLRLYLVEAPAAIGLPRWREIDASHGGGSLRQGIEAVLEERADPALDAAALTVLLTGALNEAALWIADTDGSTDARQAMQGTVDTLLSRLFTT